MPREEFVRMMTSDLPERPAYFALDVALNREGAAPLAERPLPPALEPAAVEDRVRAGAQALDVRASAAHGAGHVPGSVNIGLGGQFASWAGTLLDPRRPIVVVADDEGQVREAVTRLARVGIENVAGFLAGGVAAWDRSGRPVGRTPQIAVDELRDRLQSGAPLAVLDVRRPGEYDGGHVPGAVNVPLHRLTAEAARVPGGVPLAVICAGGYRSSAATALLRATGVSDLYNVVGGTSAWVSAGFPVDPPAAAPNP
jgi:rhodanese-related sulfurtransferase